MSNYLLKLQVNEVQAELNALDAYTRQQVFAGGLHNPLGSPMLCQGNDIVGARNISGQSLTIEDGATLGYLTSGGIDATSFSQTYDGTTYASIISGVVTATKVSTDTIESKTTGGIITVDSEINTGNFISSGIIQAAEFQQMGSGLPQVTITGGGVDCLTLSAYNIAGTDAGTVNMLNEVDMNSHPISKTNYIGFNGQVAGAPYLTIQNNATLTTRGFGYSEQGGGDPVIFYDNKYNQPPGSGSVGSLEQVLTEGSLAPDKTMSVLGVTTASLTAADPVAGITVNDNITLGPKSVTANTFYGQLVQTPNLTTNSVGKVTGDSINFLDNITLGSKNITGVGTISASIVGAPSVNSGTLTTGYISGTDSSDVFFNNNIAMEQHNISDVGNLTIGSDTVYNKLLTGGTNPAQLYITRDGTTFGSVYDSHYNQPPSSGGSQDLSQVLTEGNSAPLQTLSVLGITTAALGSPNLDGIQLNNMLVCNGQAITGVDGISLFNYNTNPNKFSTLTTGYLGGDSGTLYLNQGRGYGAIYDSFYNLPPSAAIPTLTEVLTADNSAPALDMTVKGITVESIAGSSASTDPVSPGLNLSITTGVVLNNNYIHNCSEFKLSTLSPTEYCYMMPHPSGGLQITSTGWGTGTGVVFDTEYNKLPPVVTPTLDEVLTAGALAPSKTITVDGVTADTVDATTSVTTNTVTGTGTVDGFTALNMGSAVNMNNAPLTHTPYVGFNGEGVNNTPALYKTIQNKSTPSYTGFGYSEYGGADPVIFYDNKYNQPPSTATPSLDEVLTVGASAPSKTITVGGVITDVLGANSALGIIANGNLRMTKTETLDSSLYMIDTAGDYNAISTVTDGALGPTLSITRDGTTRGFIYDSHYNQPPAGGVGTLEQVLTAGHTAPALDMTVKGITVESITGSTPSDPTHPKIWLDIGTDVDYNQNNITGVGTITASTISSTVVVNAAGIVGTDLFNGVPILNIYTNLSMNQKDITDTASIALNGATSLAPYLVVKNTSISSTERSFGYAEIDGSNPTTFYDDNYNKPPTPSLDEVLTVGASAPSKTITVEGVTADTVTGTSSVSTSTLIGTQVVEGFNTLVVSTAIAMGGNQITHVPYIGFDGQVDGGVAGPYLGFYNKSTSATNKGFEYSNTDGSDPVTFYDNKYNLPPSSSGSTTQVIPDGSYPTVLSLQFGTSSNQNLVGPFGSFDLGSNTYNSFIVTFDSLGITSPSQQGGVEGLVFTMYLSTSTTAYPESPLVNMIQCSSLTGTFDSNGSFQLNSPGILQSILPTSGASNTITLYIMATIASSTLDNYNIELTISNFIITASNVPTSTGAFIPQQASGG